MIKLENHLGTIEISQGFFENLVGKAASECFGVSGLANSSPYQEIHSVVTKKDLPNKGVKVKYVGGHLMIDLHILVTYGVNISEIVKSIVNKVRYSVEDATGMSVGRVNVYVDGMKS